MQQKKKQKKPKMLKLNRVVLSQAYDYVVVGGGAAGCVLASRLSEDPNVSVCMIEAGPKDDSLWIKMPLGVAQILPTWGKEGWIRSIPQKLNWAFHADPEPYLNNRQPYQPRGRTLGGSSSINAMLYVRGHKGDYDHWEELGNKGWGWKECEKAFRSIEDGLGATEGAERSTHLNVERGRDSNLGLHPTIVKTFLNSSADVLNRPINYDYNNGDTAGPVVWDRTVKRNARHSPSTAFIRPFMEERKNLTVLTNHHCTKVDVEVAGDKKTATGVRCVKVSDGGKPKSGEVLIKANKRVVMSMGALQTPQVMLLSGIGPEEELKKHGITTVHHLPTVGKRLLDHVDVGVFRGIDTTKGVSDSTVTPGRLPFAIKELLTLDSNNPESREKNLWGALHTECGYFTQSETSKKAGETRPDLQAHFCAGLVLDHAREPAGKPGFTTLLCLLYPKSEGYVGLRSANPTDKPKIVMNYLTHEEDRQRMIEGVRGVVEVLNTKAFRDITKDDMGMSYEDSKDDNKVLEYLRAKCDTIYHPVSTCRMGKDETNSVVNDRLCVHGVDNLMIADASVFPYITGGNTQAPSMMVGERAARFIQAGEA